MGSELLLKSDGRFEWMLTYGAVDQFAQGTWQLQGNDVLLSATLPTVRPVYRLFTARELNISKPAEKGTWIAIVGVPHVGPMSKIEVKFESHSGATSAALTDRNGDAIVKMPDHEQWVRAGLRVPGSENEWEWFTISKERASERIAGFAISSQWAQPSAFKELTLSISQEGLAIQDKKSGLRGVYTK